MLSAFLKRLAALLLVLIVVAVTGPVAAQTERPRLAITQAVADPGTGTVLIDGQFFLWGREANPVVTLAGYPLAIVEVSQVHILARLPAEELLPGSYRLEVSRGPGAGQHDAFSLAVGAVGPPGPEGPAGPKGDPGEVTATDLGALLARLERLERSVPVT